MGLGLQTSPPTILKTTKAMIFVEAIRNLQKRMVVVVVEGSSLHHVPVGSLRGPGFKEEGCLTRHLGETEGSYET